MEDNHWTGGTGIGKLINDTWYNRFICFFTDNGTQSSNKDCKTVNVKNETGLYATANAAGGYDLRYNPGTGNRIWYDDDRQYLYPVPAQVIRDYESAGYKLSQNPNWN